MALDAEQSEGSNDVPPKVVALIESLNAELHRQKIMFEGELRRQRETMDERVSKLEAQLEQREAECKSLQHSVTILGRSVDAITEALEKVAPNVSVSSHPRGRSPVSRPSGSRASSPKTNPQGRNLSPSQRSSRVGSSPRPPSPVRSESRRSQTPGRGNSISPATLNGTDPFTQYSGYSRLKGMKGTGPMPIISSGRTNPTTPRGATAVRELHADYIAGIKHPPFLQSVVYPPEGMEDLQGKPSQLPQAKLELQHIYGCSVDGYNNNICYACDGHTAIYYAASVGVAMNIRSRAQSFCFHHTDEITCVAVHPRGNLVASGQRGHRGAGAQGPSVVVWDCTSMVCKAQLKDFHEHEIGCVEFSKDGQLLATVGGTQQRSLALYRWESKELIATCRLGTEPVYNIIFNAFNHKTLTLVGRRFVKFFEMQKGGAMAGGKLTLKPKTPVLQEGFKLSHIRVVCATCIDPAVTIMGTDSGSLLIWNEETLTSVLPDVHAGGVSAVKAVVLEGRNRADVLLSAGRDGVIRVWQGDAVMKPSLPATGSFDLADLAKEQINKETGSHAEQCLEQILQIVTTGKAPIRSMDVRGVLIEGTMGGVRVLCNIFSNQILEIDVGAALNRKGKAITLLHQGHSAFPTASLQANAKSHEDVIFDNTVAGVAVHPTAPLVATVGSDSTLRFWHMERRELWHTVQLPAKGLCLDFSRDGRMVAVGLEAGGEASGGMVYSITIDAGQQVGCKPIASLEESAGEDTLCVRFDPQGHRLALGGGHARVDLYDAQQNFQCIASTKGHAAAVTHLDWASDSSAFQTDDRTPEHLYFHKDGSRVTRPIQMRSVAWERWTCTFGWHVQGIWNERMDAYSIGSVDVSPDRDLCIVGDSAASVNLFTFPIPMQQASYKKYRGHSNRVTAVTFSTHSPSVFSAGGDGCLLQWQVVRLA